MLVHYNPRVSLRFNVLDVLDESVEEEDALHSNGAEKGGVTYKLVLSMHLETFRWCIIISRFEFDRRMNHVGK